MIKINVSDKAVLIYKGKEISYKEIDKSAAKLSSILPIDQGDRVIIFSENSPYWIYCLFAVWRKGAIAVAVDFMSSRDEFEYILNDCIGKIILCSRETYKTIESIENLPKTVIIDEVDYEAIREEDISIDESVDRPALILYTSGTTGNPKGVVLTFDNLISNIESVEKVIKIDAKNDKTLAILPFHHSYPLMVSLLIPLHIGATIIFLDKFTPEDILKKFQDYKVTILIGVPRLYYLFHRKIFEKINSNLFLKNIFKIVKVINIQAVGKLIFRKVHIQFGGNVKYFVSGGAKLDIDVAKDLWALGFKVIEGYGLTETSPIISFNPPDRVKLGSVGKVIDCTLIKIKEDGEILVKGRNVFKEYFRKEKETKESFENGYFKTGDIGFLDEDGYLYITGRKKEMIVLPNGKNINPEEIENLILKKFNIVKEIAVLEKDGKLFAIIYPDFEYIKREKILNLYQTIKWNVVDKYNLSVPAYKRIGGFVIVNTELPKTRLGKIKRFMLEDFIKKQQERRDLVEPQDSIYYTIKEYLKNYTKITPYPDSHIEIDLGLDSLGKIEFITFLETNFGLTISEEFLAENQTLEKIYSSIKDRILKFENVSVDWSDILKEEVEFSICDKCLTVYIRPFLSLFFKLYNNLTVKGIDNIPNRPVIFASNHQSYLDGFLIVSSLPKKVLEKTVFLAEEGYFNTNFRKWVAKNSGIILVNINKDIKSSLIKVAWVIRQGKNVVIFPEGARTRDGSLLEFRKSFAILSKELDVPVVPVLINGAFESFPISAKFPKPYKVEVRFLEPVYPSSKSYDEIVTEVYNKIKENLGR